MSVEITERAVGEVTILELAGRITMGAGAQLLDEKLQAAAARSAPKVLLEMSRVTFIDSQGIKSLVRGFITLEKLGGTLKLLNMSDKARIVLEITHLLSVIKAFEDEAAALKSFEEEAAEKSG